MLSYFYHIIFLLIYKGLNFFEKSWNRDHIVFLTFVIYSWFYRWSRRKQKYVCKKCIPVKMVLVFSRLFQFQLLTSQNHLSESRETDNPKIKRFIFNDECIERWSSNHFCLHIFSMFLDKSIIIFWHFQSYVLRKICQFNCLK